MPFLQPTTNCLINLVQLPRKEMIRSRNNDQPVLSGQRFHQRLHLPNLPMLVMRAVHK